MIPLGVLIVVLFYFPSSKKVSVAADVFLPFIWGNLMLDTEQTTCCSVLKMQMDATMPRSPSLCQK